ncbi:hypothetical protein ARMGADRAFT_470792, partial [Armillaria gallica]
SKSRRGPRRDGERLKSGRNSNKGAPSTSGPQASIYKTSRRRSKRTSKSLALFGLLMKQRFTSRNFLLNITLSWLTNSFHLLSSRKQTPSW